MLARIGRLIDHLGSKGVLSTLRALLRGNEFFLVPLALLVGVVAGAIVTLMSEIAQVAHVLIFGIPIDVRLSANEIVNPWAAMIAPAAGGLLLGLMEWSRRRWKISNAVDPIEANALRGGRLSLRDSVVVSSQTLISNGCGASVGLEAGYTQIGAGAASLLGRFFNLRRNDLRLIVGCGAAGAIAAAFGAPITGAFYACELIVGVYSVSSAAPILAASLSAALTARWLGGAPYSLNVPQVGAVTGEQYLAIIVLALIVAAVGIVVMRSSALVERVFNQPWLPVWLKTPIGGLCIGGMAILTPQVLAAGHGAMVLDLHRSMAMDVIAMIIGLKLCACLISLASGFRGGLFFASLFVGSLIGKLYAMVLQLPMFGIPLDPLASMLTGMATLGVAIVGGPLTMSFLVLEMTRSVDVTAAVLAACIVTSVCVRALFGHSFSTWRLHLRGETIRSANDVGWLRNLTVERMMRTDVASIPATATIAQCRGEYLLGSRQAVIAVDGLNRYCGIVLLPELFSGDLDSIADEIQVIELIKFQDVTLFPAMNVKSAMKVFDDAGAEVLAVTEAGGSRKVIGFLTESYARRRYAEELDQVTRGLLGQV
ncbi:chloride channel protein [Bradyrhizobium prioriisuperbiae]|uniref:chloride channel protein n=1 Tax=Bradyrhizobium prioriisuperbiae TaxID=2854389 RepID=UPI0028E6A757|nr:chloride channel protein [Bradyrhizobium prioritasuperba]